MKMWPVKIIILLLFCYACPLTGKDTQYPVYFVSKNFNNVLHWDPKEPDSPEEKVLYSVQYWSDLTEMFQIKPECQNITDLSCDLTEETPSVHDVYYLAQVHANGSFYGKTKRFKPIAETIFGPPILSINTTVTLLHVNVMLPLGPNGVSIADIISNSTKGPSKSVIIYTLNITKPKWAALVNENITGEFIVNLKNNQTEYCGYVFYRPLAEFGRSGSEKASFCATLPDVPWTLLPWLFLGGALLAIIMMSSVVLMCNYVKDVKANHMPQSLVTNSSILQKVIQFPDEKCILSKAEINTPHNETVYSTIQVMSDVHTIGFGGYSPQDILRQAWKDRTYSSVSVGAHTQTQNPQDTSTHSSDLYGAVAVHVPTEQNATGDGVDSNLPLSSSGDTWSQSGMHPKVTSCWLSPLYDLDAPESSLVKPVQLHVVRNTDGQLVLASLNFQLQSSTGEKTPLLLDLIDSREEGPSLASLQRFDSSEWLDTGCESSTQNTPTQLYCNSNYSPSHPVTCTTYLRQECQNTPASEAIFESSYKQNWISAILIGGEAKQL